MCGRTSLFAPPGRLEERFDAESPSGLQPRYNIAPREDLAVIRNEDPGRIRLDEWGLVPRWADDPDATRFINARAESIEDKPSFAGPAEKRRCLVLADGFYEWEDRRMDTRPYRVEREDGGPFAMAGLWERRTDDDGERITVTIITTEPNEVVASLHDRMAAVLGPDEEQDWLDADDPDRRARLLSTPDPEPFHAYPVSKAVNDPSAEGPDLVEHADVPDDDPQTGLGDF
ncbi:MAG: SOS response-associated peptidase [Halobacteriales archaeon]